MPTPQEVKEFLEKRRRSGVATIERHKPTPQEVREFLSQRKLSLEQLTETPSEQFVKQARIKQEEQATSLPGSLGRAAITGAQIAIPLAARTGLKGLAAAGLAGLITGAAQEGQPGIFGEPGSTQLPFVKDLTQRFDLPPIAGDVIQEVGMEAGGRLTGEVISKAVRVAKGEKVFTGRFRAGVGKALAFGNQPAEFELEAIKELRKQGIDIPVTAATTESAAIKTMMDILVPRLRQQITDRGFSNLNQAMEDALGVSLFRLPVTPTANSLVKTMNRFENLIVKSDISRNTLNNTLPIMNINNVPVAVIDSTNTSKAAFDFQNKLFKESELPVTQQSLSRVRKVVENLDKELQEMSQLQPIQKGTSTVSIPLMSLRRMEQIWDRTAHLRTEIADNIEIPRETRNELTRELSKIETAVKKDILGTARQQGIESAGVDFIISKHNINERFAGKIKDVYERNVNKYLDKVLEDAVEAKALVRNSGDSLAVRGDLLARVMNKSIKFNSKSGIDELDMQELRRLIEAKKYPGLDAVLKKDNRAKFLNMLTALGTVSVRKSSIGEVAALFSAKGLALNISGKFFRAMSAPSKVGRLATTMGETMGTLSFLFGARSFAKIFLANPRVADIIVGLSKAPVKSKQAERSTREFLAMARGATALISSIDSAGQPQPQAEIMIPSRRVEAETALASTPFF